MLYGPCPFRIGAVKLLTVKEIKMGANVRGLMTIPEFLRDYPMGRSTFYRLVAKGELIIRKIGRSSRLRIDEVEAWAANLPTMPTNDNR